MGTKITGIGVYIPRKVLTNFDLERMVDTSDEWITTRTGIKERRIEENLSVSQMGVKASLEALKEANLKPQEIDTTIVATLTPQMVFPSTATLLQGQLGTSGYAFDISAACSGFIYGLHLANSLLKTKNSRRVLLVGAERISQIVNWKDRSTCVLFGDGAGAVVLENSDSDSEIISSVMYSDGNWEILYCEWCDYLKMKGREVFKRAVINMAKACHEVLERANLKPENVDLVIPHQANVRIINSLMEKLGIPKERVYINIQRYGNTSAASIPIALYEARKEGRLKRGMLVLLTAMGGGLTWGATLLRF